ncbi:MAG: metal-dependent transcriptional regulator [Lachnospiraceae bacterium]|nr:metal-dependent transcriptional regulator [Lachnospiraceae bacterium]
MDYNKQRSNESMEDYLETILVLQKSKGNVRSIDIANELNFTKASVSVAMKNLRERDYITVQDNGYILLTDTGRKIAKKVYERHTILSSLFMNLGVSEKTALEDACKIEHFLSDESFRAIKRHIKEHSSKAKNKD